MTARDVTLDAGALIAVERAGRDMAVLVEHAEQRGQHLLVPAGVLAQVWRDGRQQVRLATLLRAPFCTVVPLDARMARLSGHLCAATGTSDIVDASVVVLARERGHRIITSDPGDLRRLDPNLQLIVV